MKCKNCGFEFEDGIFCPECGTNNSQISLEEQEKVEEEKARKDAEDNARRMAELEAEKARLELRQKEKEAEIAQTKLEQEKLEKEKREAERMVAEEKAKRKADKVEANEGKIWAVLSVIMGALSIISMGLFVVPEIVGIVFSVKGKKQGKMRKMAMWGLVLNIISVIIAILILVLVFTDKL